MLTRLPLSLMVELAVDCSTKYSVPSALMNSGGGLSSAIADPHSCGVLLVLAGSGDASGDPDIHPEKYSTKIIVSQK
jgi:hypothetical protein